MNRIASLLSIFLLTFSVLIAQNSPPVTHFLSGDKVLAENAASFIDNPEITDAERMDGYFYRYIQFNEIPSLEEQKRLSSSGIHIIEYIPDNAYLVAIPNQYNLRVLASFDIRSIVPPDVEDKMDQRLVEGTWPSWADAGGNQVKVILKAYPKTTSTTFTRLLKEADIQFGKEDIRHPFVYTTITQAEFLSVAGLPFIQYVDLGPDPGEPEDSGGMNLQRANLINNNLPGGLRYDGSGVSVLVRDDGVVGPHIDFQGRLFDFTGGSDVGTHGDGVAGVFAGAGNLEPLSAGSASGADVYVSNYQADFTDNTIDLHVNNDVVITNSSYSNGCNAGYTVITQRVDQQMIDHPNLMHVFSGGNSNNNDCGYGAGNQWGNVTGGHKVGKNVMATANLNADGTLRNSSSRGPAHDGRIKPDISAHGANERSTAPNNTYQTFGGTSAAAPTMAGSYAQLYQAYRELNGGMNPNAGFLKAVVLNTATDLGNVGPDFKFGWGRIDAFQGLKVLQDQSYTSSSIAQGGSNDHTITIPANVAEARVMVYWVDPAAAVNASRALINNLDIHVDDPSATRHDPWVLDVTPNPTNLDLPATTGRDDLNNMEQVSITAPAAGDYTLTVEGSAVPMGAQEYYVVWAFFYDEIMVTYPFGGEGLVPGETERIHWDAFGDNGSFTLDYSTNNGGTWTTITTGLSGDTRLFSWNIPNEITSEALVRVRRGGQSDVSDANFSIIGLPSNISFANFCNTGVTLRWSAVTGADSYRVYKLGEKYMEVVGTTTALNYDFTDLPTNETSWFSVQALSDAGIVGRRANAVSHFTDPNIINCRNTILIEKTVDQAVADAGDTLEYTITFTSFYDNQITGISITDNLDPNWTLIPGSLSCGSESGGVITIDSAFVNPDETISCSFKVRSSPYSATSVLLEDDFESGTGNWTINNATGPETWSLSTAQANSPTNSFFTPSRGLANNTQYLISQPLTLEEGSELSFFHFYNTESGWDGGFLDISTDNGASWMDLGPFMTLNGYNGGLGNGSNNTIDNRPAFTGNSGGFIETIADLSSFGTSSVIIRFGFGEDDNTNEVGWFVDDVKLQAVVRQENTACVSFDQGGTSVCSSVNTLLLPCQSNCDLCTDGVQNGDETGIDCGGSFCSICPCSQMSDTLTYDNTTIADMTMDRIKNVIELKGPVNTAASSTIDLRAGLSIDLTGEFTTGATSDLTISIEDCENN